MIKSFISWIMYNCGCEVKISNTFFKKILLIKKKKKTYKLKNLIRNFKPF